METLADELRERIMESLVTFPGLKLKKFNFSRVLKKVYLANTREFPWPSTKIAFPDFAILHVQGPRARTQ